MRVPWALLAALALSYGGGGGVAAAADAPTPVGTWRTFSDKDGHESGRVQIVERDGALYGRVTAILDPAKRAGVCEKCRDDRRGQPVLGMEILRGMRLDGRIWDGGEILDPEEGATYRCTMRLEDAGRTLVVRGFVGLAMFGRSQHWQRAS